MIERFSARLARELSVIDLDEVDELPFALWIRWYQHDLVEPFSDRRPDLLAFLSASVLSGVIHAQITPTEEMFRLSAPLQPLEGVDEDAAELEAEERSFGAFAARMAQRGL